MGVAGAERVNTYLHADGSVVTHDEPLPTSHYMHEDFHPLHMAAMEDAIIDHAAHRNIPTQRCAGSSRKEALLLAAARALT